MVYVVLTKMVSGYWDILVRLKKNYGIYYSNQDGKGIPGDFFSGKKLWYYTNHVDQSIINESII